MTFCLTRYAFAGHVWLRRMSVAMFLVVLFYAEVPWAGIVLDMGKG